MKTLGNSFALEKQITTPALWKVSYTCYACFWKSQCPSSTFAWCGQQKVLENPARYKLLSKTTMLKVNMKGPSYGCSTIWLGGKLHWIECCIQIWHVVQNKSTLPHITWNLSCHEVQELQRHKKSNSPLLLISVTEYLPPFPASQLVIGLEILQDRKVQFCCLCKQINKVHDHAMIK
jgi:hypothetical protein